MSKFLVTAHFSTHRYSALIEAENRRDAITQALMQRKLPIEVLEGPNGAVPIYWIPKMKLPTGVTDHTFVIERRFVRRLIDYQADCLQPE